MNSDRSSTNSKMKLRRLLKKRYRIQFTVGFLCHTGLNQDGSQLDKLGGGGRAEIGEGGISWLLNEML
jgi:hypothetical protein